MRKQRLYRSSISVFIVLLTAIGAHSQSKNGASATAVMWERVNIGQRDLFWGAGGRAGQPDLRKITLVRKETGGNNLKYRIKDGSGRTWVAKIADESQPEVAANRLLHGVGYKTEIDYLVPELVIPGKGQFRNVRLEARPDNVERLGRWSWKNNPFVDTNEFQGLKIMMALVNNWDIKDGNNAILEKGGRHYYVVSDMGSSFGKLAPIGLPFLNRFGRSVNRPEHFHRSEFIKGIEKDGDLDFAYKAKAKGMYDHISPDEGRWMANLLNQLSEKQIHDAFRAAGYGAEDATILARAIQGRIRALDTTTTLYGMLR